MTKWKQELKDRFFDQVDCSNSDCMYTDLEAKLGKCAHVIEKPLIDFISSLLQSARQQEREAIVEACQKEMYEALEGVAQHGNNLVNKEDIKVWIHNLPSNIKSK